MRKSYLKTDFFIQIAATSWGSSSRSSRIQQSFGPTLLQRNPELCQRSLSQQKDFGQGSTFVQLRQKLSLLEHRLSLRLSDGRKKHLRTTSRIRSRSEKWKRIEETGSKKITFFKGKGI
jgi:hypothetical protein